MVLGADLHDDLADMARLAQGATGFVGILGREDGELACAQHDGGNGFGGLEQAVIVRLVVGLDGFEALAVGELQKLLPLATNWTSK